MMNNKSYLITEKTCLFDILYKDLKRIESVTLYPIKRDSKGKKLFYVDVKENSFADKIIKNNCLNVKERSYKDYIAEI